MLKNSDKRPMSDIKEAFQTIGTHKDLKTIYEQGNIPYNLTSAPGVGYTESISQAQQNYMFFNPMSALK